MRRNTLANMQRGNKSFRRVRLRQRKKLPEMREAYGTSPYICEVSCIFVKVFFFIFVTWKYVFKQVLCTNLYLYSFSSSISFLTFPTQAELPVHRVLGVSNNFSQNKVTNQKFSVLDPLVIGFGGLFLIASHPYNCIFYSFFDEIEVAS